MAYPSICGFAEDSVYHFRPGLHLSEKRPPSATQLKLLLRELRTLTGFVDLQIKSNGDLSLGNRLLLDGGSAIARRLLAAAIDSKDSFAVESSDRSATIAFAEIQPVLEYRDATDDVRQEWCIRIDFSDFKELHGDQAAIKSFGAGMSLMHELVHAILDYPDPLSANDQLGQCEGHLNLIRAELGLPLRQNYFPNNRYASNLASTTPTFQGEITFGRRDNSLRQPKEYSLTFDLDRVFDVGGARPRSLIYSDLARLSRK